MRPVAQYLLLDRAAMVEPVVAALNPFSNYFYPNAILQLLNVTSRHLSMDALPLSASGTEPTVFYRNRAKGKERAVHEGDSGTNMHWLHDSRCKLARDTAWSVRLLILLLQAVHQVTRRLIKRPIASCGD